MKENAKVRRALVALGCSGLAIAPTSALAQNSIVVDVSAGVSAARNPFLEPGRDTESAAAYVEVAPSWRLSDEQSTITLDGAFTADQHARLYGTTYAARANLNVARRLSPATTLRGRAGVRSAKTSALDLFLPTGEQTTLTPIPIVISDVAFGGRRSRTTLLDASVGLDTVLSERDRISGDVATVVSRFTGPDQSDYRSSTAGLRYSRTLTERTSLFASTQVGVSDYLGQETGDGLTVSPTLGISTQLGPRLSAEAGAGVSYTRVNLGDGRHSSRVVPTVQGRLCREMSRGSSCLFGSRASQPTANAGLTTVSNISLNHGVRLSERDELSANASYTLTESTRSLPFTSLSPDVLTASAQYTRTFNRRFSAFVNPSYTSIFDDGTDTRSNPAVRVGLRYRFGQLQ